MLPGRWLYKCCRAAGPTNVAGPLALMQVVDEILGGFGVGMILTSDKSD